MTTNLWMRRRMTGIVFAVAGVAVVGMLAVGSAAAKGGPNVNPLHSPLGTPRAGGERQHGIGKESLAAAAEALGIDEAVLKAALDSGKSIADVAQAHNVNVSVVVNAIVAERQADLAKAVTDGKLTQAQADEKLTKFESKVTELVSEAPPSGGPRGPQHSDGPRATAASAVQQQGGRVVSGTPAAAPAAAQNTPRGGQNDGGRGGQNGPRP
ncbi:MAG: hypothetical protein NTZ50_07995 [Chloroflexi bacterium]|nr:hypothetical protein [Chloroflexota bacterium]